MLQAPGLVVLLTLMSIIVYIIFILSIYSGNVLEQHMISKLHVDMHNSNPSNKQGLLSFTCLQPARIKMPCFLSPILASQALNWGLKADDNVKEKIQENKSDQVSQFIIIMLHFCVFLCFVLTLTQRRSGQTKRVYWHCEWIRRSLLQYHTMHILVTKDVQDFAAMNDHLSKDIMESRTMINECASWDSLRFSVYDAGCFNSKA